MDVSHNEKFRMSNLYYLKKNQTKRQQKNPSKFDQQSDYMTLVPSWRVHSL